MRSSFLKYSLFLLLTGCIKKGVDPIVVDPVENPIENPVVNPIVENTSVNTWIYTKLKEYYFWEKDMKQLSETDIALNPDEYFKSLLIQPGEVDRFSWIQESSEELKNSLNGKGSIFGFKYKPFYANPQKTRITYAVTYALKNSVAERMGIKRGDFITKVNGSDLTLENYSTALSDETVTLTLGNYLKGTINDTEKTVELTKEITQAEALQYSTILNIADKKIGYFVYTQFLTTSDRAINKMFGDFKSEGINELIVDFRYNPGGYISSAEIISSLIVKNLNTNNLMTRQIWNEQQMAGKSPSDFETNFLSSTTATGSLNNLTTLDRVYFLVSNGSASASELVINNLKPYMNVILVGEHTYGKNVGSITIEENSVPKKWNWGMQPIVLKSVNAVGDSEYGTKTGFLPDIEIADNILPYSPFGDPDERLLNAALNDILGQVALAKNRKSKPAISTSRFESTSNEAIYGDPFLDRKEMWITEFPWVK
jgi:carboxyl-terminal processing protease